MVWSSKNKGRYRDSLVAAHAAMVDNPQLGGADKVLRMAA